MESRHRGLSFGVFLLTLGLIWILINTGVITWSVFDALFVLWPLIFVIIGVNIIFRRNGLVRAGAWVLFLAVIISYGYFLEDGGSSGKNLTAGEPVNIDRPAEIQNAVLRIGLGGAKINLDSNTSNIGRLLEASLPDKGTKFSNELRDSKVYLAFEKKSYTFGDIRFNNNNASSFHLNRDVVWDLDIDMGAVDGNFDISGLRVGNLSLDEGAASTKLIMGAYNTKLNINAGVSRIEVVLPQNAGIKVKIDGGLNNTNFNDSGWEKRNDGWYYSPGYDGKEFQLEARVTMGVGKFTVSTSA